jgi:hypothetical protein
MQRRRVIARAVGIGAWCLAGMAVLAAGGGPQGRQGGPPSAANVTPPTGTAAISGVVTDAVTGRPIAGAVVSVTGTRVKPVAGVTAASNPRIRLLTDEQGRFVAGDLPGDFNYTVTANRFGYVDGVFGRRGIAGTGSRPITLADSQWFRDARVELTPHASISGTVVDEAGEPLVDVRVRAYADIPVAGGKHLATSTSTMTDDHGRLRLPELAPARYLVAVPSIHHTLPPGAKVLESSPSQTGAPGESDRAAMVAAPLLASPGGHRLMVGPNSPAPVSGEDVRQAYATTFHPAARTMSEAVVVDLKAGEDRFGVDVQLRPVAVSTISGRLEGPPEAIGNMPLRLLAAGAEGMGPGSEAATTVTGGDGAFTFANVPAGSYTIIAARTIGEYTFGSDVNRVGVVYAGARLTGFTSSRVTSGAAGTSLMRHSMDGDASFYGRRAVTLGNRDVADVRIPVGAGVTISGELRVAPGSPPRPLSGMIIMAEPANGDPALTPSRSLPDGPGGPSTLLASAAAPGVPAGHPFTIRGVLPGEFLLRTLIGAGVESVIWNGRDHTDVPIDTTSGRDITGVIITLTSQTTSVTGTVRDKSGQVATSAAVVVFPADSGLWVNYGVQPLRIRSVTASTNGAYQFQGLLAGDYLMVAVEGDQAERWKDPAFLARASRSATRLKLQWGDKRAQDLMLQEVR